MGNLYIKKIAFLLVVLFVSCVEMYAQTVFTSSGSWTCPTGVTSIQVEAWGGGGAGGNGGSSNKNAGGGGGGGGYTKNTSVTVVPGTSYTITIGAGGLANTVTVGADGNPGGTTTATFGGTTVSAPGGSTGQGYTAGGNGGAGGIGSTYSGGTGGNGDSGTGRAGGGGEGAGTTANGGNASGGTGGSGTDGGDGATSAGAANFSAGVDATVAYGGGGSGSVKNNIAGDGYAGKITITCSGCYCIAPHTVTCTANINTVTFNSLSNSGSGCTSVDGTAYTKYAGSGSNTTSVTKDSTYSISITHAGATGKSSVWIDYDQDGSFEASEWTEVAPASSAAGAYSANITIPSTATAGTTGMRVRFRSAASGNESGDACTSFASGETEDYVITICGNTARTVSSDDADNSIACSEDIQLTLAAGSGTLTIWQSSSNNTTWSNIGGATSSPYTSGALTSTTYYRAKITDGSCVVYTASLQITVVPTAGTASVPTPTTICYNTTKVLSLTGYAGSIQWQESDDNGGADPWGNVVGGTGPTTATYTSASLTSLKYFRAKVTGAGCSDVYSNTLTLTVAADGTAVWTNGASTTTWGTTTNWCGTVPDATTADVIIPAGLSQYPVTGVSRTVRDLTVASGASLSITSATTFSVYGNVDASGTFTHNGSTWMEFYGATKTIKGTFVGDNGGGIDINSGASYTLNGNFTIGQFQVSSSGTISLSSYTLTVDDVTTASFNLAAGGTLNQNTGILQIEESTPTFSGTFNSNTGTTYYNVDASAIFPNSMTYYNLKIATYSGRIHHASSGTSLTIGNNFELVAGSSGGECHHHSTTLVVPGNVTIASGSTLDLNVSDGKSLDIGGNITNSGTISCFTSSAINVFGNFTNNGTFTQNTSTVTMDGTGAQTIGGTTNTTFYNLVIDKSAGTASLGVNKTVSQTLTLTTGRLDLGGYTLTVSRSSAAAIGRTSGYIYSENTSNASKLKWNLGSTAGTYVFPFGIGTAADEYIPFTMELTAGTIGNVTLSTYATGAALTPFPSTPTAVTNITSGGSSNQANMVRRYWQIDKDGASGTTNITFKYADAEVPTNGEGTDIFAQRWNGGSTWDVGIGTHTAGSNQVQATGVTTFSPWALVKSANPLPITLTRFDAIAGETSVNLQWSTSSEINNDFFTVEKSMDGENFEFVAEVEGAGNSNQILNYSTVDKNPYSGVSYYRLKQTDYDGQYSYSEIKPVSFSTNANFDFAAYPNPVGAYEAIKLSLSGNGDEMVTIKIQDLLGKLYFDQSYQMENEEQIINIASNTKLSQGIYMISCTVNNQVYTKKILVK